MELFNPDEPTEKATFVGMRGSEKITESPVGDGME